MKISGARIVVETLIEQGCDTIFGYPGGQVLDLFDELYRYRKDIKNVLTADEQGAAHAADGYARATGKVGVAVATSGPGATNLVTGIATAYLDSVPMVAITGNVSNALIGRDSFQEVDITDITIPITKHNFIVKDVKYLAETIRLAFKLASSGRQGPVLVDIPKDVQTAKCEYEPQGKVEKDAEVRASDEMLIEAARLISEAKKPYIYCGGGVIAGDASAEVIAFADKIDAAIGCSLMGLSAVPDDNPRFLGMKGMHGRYASSLAEAEADLIITAGARFSNRTIGDKDKFAKTAKIIQIDIDDAEIRKTVSVYLGIQGDIKDALSRLASMVQPKRLPEWSERVQALKLEEKKRIWQKGELTPYAIIDTISDNTEKGTIIATDVGQHQMWVAQRYAFKKPRTMISSGGLGTMGFGMGAAIGAYIATGERVVLVTGDGSFGMNLNELATAVSQNVPLTIVIMNNGVLGMVRQWQTMFYKKHYSSTVLDRHTDFVKVAEAFGAKGMRAATTEEFAEAFKYAFAQKGPVVIDCIIGRDEAVLPMLPPESSIDNIITGIKEEK